VHTHREVPEEDDLQDLVARKRAKNEKAVCLGQVNRARPKIVLISADFFLSVSPGSCLRQLREYNLF